ncbi:MAG TPA: glycosyltransferase [Dinghuibacter sp.]|uniref:glycosyltransferase n=1 Tax=Dinghuibacter sp. TaxID=2024697 RepID=UPI002C97474F|nr:glycosyltransferase [Dinghuibacter sp.]HTJ10975.1 glycosyltransferase [Dinghuibacter sp.]
MGIRKVIKSVKPDLVHTHFTTGAFPALLLKKRGIPYWATFHGLGMNASSGVRKVLFTLVEVFCFLRLNRIFLVNEQDRRLASRYFGRKSFKYDCLGFGCDIRKFQRENVPESVRNELREKYGIRREHCVIAFTGRFVDFKGFHLVVKAFRVLSTSYPGKYKLILMGGPDPTHRTGLDGPETEFFQNSPDIVPVGFTGHVEHYLSIADIFLFPSVKEGLPTCILEALSMGVPVISFDARGNSDVINDGHNGVLLQPVANTQENVDRIAAAVARLEADPDKREELSRNALDDRPLYSRDRFVTEHLNYYNDFRRERSV